MLDVKKAASASGTWFVSGLDDWLYFLSGPRPPVFQHPPKFEKKRLFKLLGLAISASGIILGIVTATVSGMGKFAVGVVAGSYPAIIIVTAAAILSLVHSLFAKLFRVPITIADTFYAILFMALPWMPLTALVFALEQFMRIRVIAFLTAAWLTFALIMVFFYVGLALPKIVENCPAWRCWASLILPVILFIFLIVFLVSALDFAPSPQFSPSVASSNDSASTPSPSP